MRTEHLWSVANAVEHDPSMLLIKLLQVDDCKLASNMPIERDTQLDLNQWIGGSPMEWCNIIFAKIFIIGSPKPMDFDLFFVCVLTRTCRGS